MANKESKHFLLFSLITSDKKSEHDIEKNMFNFNINN